MVIFSNTRRPLFQLLAAALAAALTLNGSVVCQEPLPSNPPADTHTSSGRFSSPSGRFDLEIPPGFERVAIADPRVPLALRPREGGFPTLNVVVTPGIFEGESNDAAARGERMRDEYRAIGLLDAKLVSAAGGILGGSPSIEVVLAYTSGGVSTTAKVSEVTLPDRRITVTWLAPASGAAVHEPSRRAILDSMTIEGREDSLRKSARPGDFGPIYAETDMSRFPVEPWNTGSNAVFLGVLIYFARRTRLDRRRYPFIVPALGVLAIGVVGGSLYHATRANNLWLILDFIPIIVLTGAASLYFWFGVVRNRWLAFLAFCGLFFGSRALRWFIDGPHTLTISLGYIGAALAVLIPAWLHARGPGAPHRRFLVWGAALFAAAISCRILDRGPGLSPLPMGTHFLWHIFGALSVGALLHYLVRVEEQRGSKS